MKSFTSCEIVTTHKKKSGLQDPYLISIYLKIMKQMILQTVYMASEGFKTIVSNAPLER